MPLIATLNPPPKIIIFDAYGTVFDVHSAVMRHKEAIGPQAQAFSDTWRLKQLEYSWVLSLCGQYRDFWQLTQEALDFALAKFADIDHALRPKLLAAYRILDAYPDAAALLDQLKMQGLKTGILSNGEPAMLAEAAASSGLAMGLDAVLSVDAIGVFKTAPATYQLVLDHFGCARTDVLFISSNRWDVAGAAAFGFPTIWVNRAGNPDEYPELAPVAMVRDLSQLG